MRVELFLVLLLHKLKLLFSFLDISLKLLVLVDLLLNFAFFTPLIDVVILVLERQHLDDFIFKVFLVPHLCLEIVKLTL